ncbi:MAG: DUF488 domain-containing protein [Deferribacteraceae bacterium]|jgi:uncharacterized protein (DUF488 family)|nr:DUF488 domain-containing protein [Deferribacteraceae bacterium]
MPLYTIGYAGYAIEGFIAELKKYEISILADIRVNPYSEYFSDYNKNYFNYTLKSHGIQYTWAAENMEISDLAVCQAAKSINLTGEELIVSGGLGNIALMCEEQDPSFCRRALIFSRKYHKNGEAVFHIIPNSPLLSQKDIEVRLLESCFPNYREALTLSLEDRTIEELTDDAYKKRETEI